MVSQSDLFVRGVAEAPLRVDALFDEGALSLRPAACLDALNEHAVLERLIARTEPLQAGVLADALLARFGGLGRILGAPGVDLARVVGVAVADELGMLHALLLRTLEFPLRRREVLTSWAAVNTYLRARLAALPREVFHVLFLDKKNQLIADERLSEGTVDHAPVYPREVVRRALELSASALVLAHNHPTGDPSPSTADIEMTKQVVAAAKALQIAVHDHLIIGADQVFSLRAQGLM